MHMAPQQQQSGQQAQLAGCCSRAAHLVQHPVQLVAGFTDAVAVVAVHDKDEALRVLEVVSPQRPDLQAQLTGQRKLPRTCCLVLDAAAALALGTRQHGG